MFEMLLVLAAAAAAAGLLSALGYLLAWGVLHGRRDGPGWEKLTGCRYAHRGLHGPGAPENSLAAFRRAAEAGYGAELDVHLTRDGRLAVIHDGDLRRIDSPKKKKRKHFLPTQELISSLGERLTRGEAVCDAHIRKALAALRDQGLDAPCKEVKECRSRM